MKFLSKLRNYFNEETFFILIMLSGLIAALVMAGCGRPTLDEFLSGKRITCDIKVKLPETKVRGNEVDLSGVELYNCREAP